MPAGRWRREGSLTHRGEWRNRLTEKEFYRPAGGSGKVRVRAGMAELVDAPDSKSGGGDIVRVRSPLPAPTSPTRTRHEMNFCSHCGQPVTRLVPEGDTHLRHVCTACGTVHYQNPKIVAGCVPEHEGRILLCRRAIEPRKGWWTIPAGFMENGESTIDAARREAAEEALADVEVGSLLAVVHVLHADQVHMMFRARHEDRGRPERSGDRPEGPRERGGRHARSSAIERDRRFYYPGQRFRPSRSFHPSPDHATPRA